MNEDRAARYNRLRRRISLLGLVWTILLFGGLVISGGSVALREAAEAGAGRFAAPPASWLVILVYVVLLMLLNEAGVILLGFYGGYVIERRYGLSNETFERWVADQVKSSALSLLLAAGAATLVYILIRSSPQHWWLGAGPLFALAIVGLTRLAPVLLLPLFYRLKPLDREHLRRRLLALADRAGARVVGAYEWGLGDKTKKANAALAGLGSTRRILVSDTMLAEYSDEEIELVFAHELAHHVHGDIWKGIAFESALVMAGFYLAAAALGSFGEQVGLRNPADPAGMPLIVLAAGGVGVVMLPVGHAISRAHERSADRFALDLTKNPAAFISAMRRLGAQNLAEEEPSRMVQWLFYSHPPIRERIASAQAFSPH